MNLKVIILLTGSFITASLCAQDWSGIPVPANPGQGNIWELQPQSDEFNYTHVASNTNSQLFEKWTDYYHANWPGPGLTVWSREKITAKNGFLQIPASRVIENGTKKISTGCMTSTTRVRYPVFVETRAKISKSCLASDVWMLSPDDTQEIDILEAYGTTYSEGAQSDQTWYAERLHLSHHVFIRHPFQDYQPTGDDTWYSKNGKIWSKDFVRIGVHWKDPWNLDYYVNGKLVRSVSGKQIIDPNGYTKGTGLSKEMDIIINMEDQGWRSDQGITPSDDELENVDDHTFKVDWIRVYKPVAKSVLDEK